MGVLALLACVWLALLLPDQAPRLLGLDAHPPDVWVVVVVWLALAGRGFRAVGWAIALGAVRDSVSLDPLGTHAFVLGTVAFCFCEGRAPRGRVEGVPRLFVTAAAALLAGWVGLLRRLPVDGVPVAASDFLHAVPVALWTTALAAGLFPLLDRIGSLRELSGRARGVPA